MKWHIGLQGKLIGALATSTAVILGISFWIYYHNAFLILDGELGNRLKDVSKGIAETVQTEQVLEFGPGEETRKSYQTFQQKLLTDAQRYELKNIYIMNARGEVVLDAAGEASYGMPIAADILPPPILSKLQKGAIQITPVYEEGLGRIYKSAFLPLYARGKNADPLAYLRVDANPQFLSALASMRRGVIAAAATTIPLAILIAALLAYAFLRPIRKLTDAARKLAEGERHIQIGLRGNDELALLGQTFDSMTISLREKEEHLEVLRGQAEERAEYMREMAGVVAHEVRNPLAATQGYLELLLRKSAPDTPGTEYGQSALHELGRLRNLVDTFLRFAKTPDIRKESTDPNLLLQEILPIVDPRAQEKKVNVILDDANTIDAPSVALDKEQMRDVLVNVCLNAIDASPIGGTVRLKVFTKNDVFLFQVEDQGTGISPELRSKIFSPFFTTKSSGTGLGLPTARRIVEAHGGKISVQSTVGNGTTFEIQVPK